MVSELEAKTVDQRQWLLLGAHNSANPESLSLSLESERTFSSIRLIVPLMGSFFYCARGIV